MKARAHNTCCAACRLSQTHARSPPTPHQRTQAACKRFADHCKEEGWILPAGRDDFKLSYKTNIPRQAGLSGSSAIACAALNVLFSHYNVPMEVCALLYCWFSAWHMCVALHARH